MENSIVQFPKQIVFHGNSLFNYSNGNTRYGFTVSKTVRGLINNKVINDYSYPGKTTLQLIAEFPTVVAPFVHEGDILIFWEHTNDLTTAIGNRTPAQALQDAKDYVTLAHNAGLIVITLNVIPRSSASFTDAKRLSFNALLDADHSWCDEYINICAEPEFDSDSDKLNTTYYNADEIHLTTAGYTIIANKIHDKLITLL
jgi:hypothetical protein